MKNKLNEILPKDIKVYKMIEMKNYRSGFWIVASALIIIFVLCNARKNIRKYLGKTK